jgi:hypothetical protein
MFIASLAFERPHAPEGHRWRKFGKIWHKDDNTSILLTGVPVCSFVTGVPVCSFVARVFENVEDPPYLDGDIYVPTGYIHQENMRKEYQWIGYIKTSQYYDHNTMYSGALEVVPMKAPDYDGKGKSKVGIFANIFKDDRDTHKGEEIPF